MRLTLHLIRAHYGVHDDVIRTHSKLQELELRDVDPGIVRAVLVEGKTKPPAWMSEVSLIAKIDPSDKKFETTSRGAVIFVKVDDRLLAVTFGTGSHLLNRAAIERGFGLRVTASVVSDRDLRGAQTRGVASNSRDQKTILPVSGEFSDLSIEVDEDWVRQLAGKASDPGLAKMVDGADSLKLSVPDFSLRAIVEKCRQVMEGFRSERYQEKFPFLTQVTPLDKSDPTVEILDAVVADRLRSRSPAISFAAPDPFEHLDLGHYEMNCGYDGRFLLDDLDQDSVYMVINSLNENKDPLEKIEVVLFNADGRDVDKHKLKSYVQAEVTHGEVDYLLSAGLWFEIRKDFSQRIRNQVAAIPDITESLQLPAWNPVGLKKDTSDKTAEGSYNKMVAKGKGYALLDKDLVYFDTSNERLEICDLVTHNAELLCVKAASQSSSLSHLVAQAVNSAQAWGSPKYQAKLTEVWNRFQPDMAVPDRKGATFVLAIATDRPGRLSDSLFFFAMVQIATCFTSLTRAGFSIALAGIEMKPGVPEKKKRATSKKA
jgi:uncharacterized protein (TIGR04141 family)